MARARGNYVEQALRWFARETLRGKPIRRIPDRHRASLLSADAVRWRRSGYVLTAAGQAALRLMGFAERPLGQWWEPATDTEGRDGKG
jgi:hypothetical protein